MSTPVPVGNPTATGFCFLWLSVCNENSMSRGKHYKVVVVREYCKMEGIGYTNGATSSGRGPGAPGSVGKNDKHSMQWPERCLFSIIIAWWIMLIASAPDIFACCLRDIGNRDCMHYTGNVFLALVLRYRGSTSRWFSFVLFFLNKDAP